MYLTEILSRSSDIEARMAKLYRQLAQRFHDSGDSSRLWHELALEEETHADVLRRELRSFEEQDESGHFLPEYAERLDQASRRLSELEQQARRITTLDDAISLALALEQATLEDLYDDLVLKGPPAFRLLCERVEAALSAQPAARVPGLPSRRPGRRHQPPSDT